MAIAVICPGCDADYSVPENLAGKTIRCKKCGDTVTVRAPKAKARVPADDDYEPRRPARRRDEDDSDFSEPKSKGPSPVLIGGLAALLLAAGAGGAYFIFSKEETKPDPTPIAKNEGGERQPVDPAVEPEQPEPVKQPPKKSTPTKAAATKPAEKPAEEPAEEPSEDPKPEEKPGEDPKPEEPKKPAAAEPPKKPPLNLGAGVANEQPGSATGMSRSDYMSGVMSPSVLERVKKASVFIKTDMEGGSATGSGWFGIEPGIVFTNAHVLNMTAPNAPPPKRLTFYLNAGTPEQRVIPNANIKILAVDRSIDLACLQVVNEPDLPAPLRVRPSAEVMQGTGLNTVGYPFGYLPGQVFGRSAKEPEVSIRRTTVVAHRKNQFGIMRRVQVEGAANPGNSGGPVVDAEGAVCCVIVEGVHRGGGTSGIALTGCVPTEYAFGLLAGRVAATEFGMPYRQDGKVRIPIKVECLDPFNRLKKVGVLAWTGNVTDKYRNPGLETPKPLPGDEHMTEVTLKYDPKTKFATGEIELPEPGSGAGYWAQVFYENAIYSRYYQPGAVIPIVGPPADRLPALLAYKPKIGTSRVVTLAGSSDLSEDEEGEGQSKDERILIRTGLKLKETTQSPNATDTVQAARLVMQFDELEMPKAVIGNTGEEADLFPKQVLRIINTFIKQTNAVGLVNKMGVIYKHNINALNIPDPQARVIVPSITGGAMEALVMASIPMPDPTKDGTGGEMKPGDTWKSTREFTIEFQDRLVLRQQPGQPQNPNATPIPQPPPRKYRMQEEWTYKYIGVRERGGVKEAVVEVTGTVKRAPGSKNDVNGAIKGVVLVELDTGVVLDADIERDFEVDTSERGIKKSAAGVYKYRIIRSASS